MSRFISMSPMLSISLTLDGTQVFLVVVVLILLIGGPVLAVYLTQVKKRRQLYKLLIMSWQNLSDEKSRVKLLMERSVGQDLAEQRAKQGRAGPKRYKMVTVLFAEIFGFSEITEGRDAERQIDRLDKLFFRFDAVIKKYDVQKVKTAGDTYMCVGGIPEKNQTNPVEMVLAAMELLSTAKAIVAQDISNNVWELRIGISTGPVMAIVSSKTGRASRIGGSTVHLASRIQSAGQPGHINITEDTLLWVNRFFDYQAYGVIPIKDKGDVKMFVINSIKTDFSINGLGLKPNSNFANALQIMRLVDLEDFVFQKLEKELPKNLYYHNLKHTIDVYTQVELIGRSEQVEPEDMLLLRTAALLHDIGFVDDYENHEAVGANFARQILPKFKYRPEQIERVVELIMVTRLPSKPKNLPESIICDADLDYLGRTDFIPASNLLYKELHERGKIGSMLEWNKKQIAFIEQHRYFTKTANRQRNVNKTKQLENIKKWMKQAKE